MSTIILTFFIFLTVVAAMAVGVIVNGRAIKGSCGGLNDIEGLGGACDICEGKKVCEKRKKLMEEQAEAHLQQAQDSQQRAEASRNSKTF